LVRLSKDSITDSTLADWIAGELSGSPQTSKQLCFQVTEELAAQYTKPLKLLLAQLRKLGCSAAIEHFGTGRNSAQLLELLPVQVVKIDGSILQSIATNPALQEKVKLLAAAARKRKVETIAERVEQASTMAVLFQLGIDYMQGHYVHEPEVVLAEP
jgi:EAL domain-containing protein (putative c-di-GMP-specific phosphodiesterase class I)